MRRAGDPGALRQAGPRVEDVGDLDQVLAAGFQRPGDHLEGPVVLLVGLEVADRAVVEVEDDVELRLELELAQVALDELRLVALLGGLLAGDLDQFRADLDADDREAVAHQLQRVAAGTAGEVEDPLSPLRAQHRQRPFDFRLGALGPGHFGAHPVERRLVPVLRNLLLKNAHLPLPRQCCPICTRKIKRSSVVLLALLAPVPAQERVRCSRSERRSRAARRMITISGALKLAVRTSKLTSCEFCRATIRTSALRMPTSQARQLTGFFSCGIARS